jgi:cyanobactin maturation PatA/PatG family protease
MSTVTLTTSDILGLQALWAETEGSPSVTICVLDGPINTSHACFQNAEIRQLSLSGSVETAPASTHGTGVAGIIFGKQADNFQGIAPGCRGLSIPIWRMGDAGVSACSQSDLARAITMAVDLGADVINISAGELSAGGANSELEEAVLYCERRGALIVAAVGNDGCCCPHVPAAIKSVLAVGAMDSNGLPMEFSNWSPVYEQSGILAPGESIMVPALDDGYKAATGTSFAAAIVSGVAGLLMSLQIKMGSAPDPLMIRRVLLETSAPCDESRDDNCARILAGRMNLSAAADEIRSRAVKAAAFQIGLGSPPSDSATRNEELTQQSIEDPSPEASIAVCGDGETDLSRDSDLAHHGLDSLSGKPEEELMSNSIIANDQPGPEGEAAELRLSTAPTAMAGGETRNAAFNGVQSSGVTPSDCGCGNSSGAGQLAYVIGRIGYDFGSRARQESLNADIIASGGASGATDPNAVIAYLSDNPYAAADLIWTVSVDSVPMYAVAPSGAFGARGYERLVELLKGEQPDAQGQAAVQRVSIPGIIQGRVRLLNSQEVPVIRPALRGIYAWNMATLSEQANKNVPAKSRGARSAQFQNFFDRFFYELRNAGLAPSERAINFAGTTLFQLADVFRAKIEEDLALHRIEVSKSLVCPQGGDCWDVSMILFDPKRTLDRAREMFRFTVDVSHEIPVRIGQVNSWATYATLL